MSGSTKMNCDLVAVLCGLVGLLVYSNTLDCGLCYDDLPAIIENQDLRPGVSWSNLIKNDFWGTPIESNDSHKSYRPLCVATFRLNYLLHELQPMGYHLVNILLHGAVCYLYVQLCGLVFSQVWPSLIAGLLFAVHPIHTEAVASVVGRADCLSALFFVLTFICYSRATKTNGISHWLLLSMLCCLCASLSKETGLTVVAVCVVYDVCIVNKMDFVSTLKLVKELRTDRPHWLKGLTLRSVALITFALVFTIVRLQLNNGLPTFGMHDNPPLYLPSPWRQLQWLHLCFVNLWLILNPFFLSCDWRIGAVPVINSLIDPWNLATVATLVSVFVLGAYSLSGRMKYGGQITFGLSLIVFPYLPASNLFFPVGFVIAERVLYLPSMGVCLLVALGVWKLLQTLQSTHQRKALYLALVYLILFYSIKTYRRNRDWFSNSDLFQSAVRTFPGNALMMNNVGQEFVKSGNMSRALSVLSTAVEIAPEVTIVQFSMAKALKDYGDYEEAEKHFATAVEMVKMDQSAELAANIYCDYGNMLTRESNLGNTTALRYALRLWETAHRLQPDDVKHMNNKGYALLKLGRYSEAQQAFGDVLRKDPNHFGASYKLGEVFLETGMLAEAEERFRRVLALKETDILTKFQLAGIIMKLMPVTPERLAEAEQLLIDVTATEPDNENAFFALGVVYYNQGRLSLAQDMFSHTLAINSTHHSALYNLGLMHVHEQKYREAKEMLSRLLDFRPLHVQGLAQMANCHAYLGDFEGAVGMYKRAVSASDGKLDWNTMSNYGRVERELGHFKESEGLFLTCLSMDGANKQSLLKDLQKTRALMSSTS